MKLGVHSHNIPARREYEILGFRETGRVRSTEVNGQPWRAVEMERPRLR